MPKQEKESYHGLIQIADEVQQHIYALKTLGSNAYTDLNAQIIEEKLHKHTVEKWDEILKNNVYPELEDLIEFLYKTATK